MADLDEGVDGHDGHVRLTLGVVHEVEIDELLQLQVVGLHAVDDVREQRTAQQSIVHLQGVTSTRDCR